MRMNATLQYCNISAIELAPFRDNMEWEYRIPSIGSAALMTSYRTEAMVVLIVRDLVLEILYIECLEFHIKSHIMES